LGAPTAVVSTYYGAWELTIIVVSPSNPKSLNFKDERILQWLGAPNFHSM